MSEELAATEVEWAVRWNEEGGIVWYGIEDEGRAKAVSVARIYGYDTPESRVSVVRRTVTYGPWEAEEEGGAPDQVAALGDSVALGFGDGIASAVRSAFGERS